MNLLPPTVSYTPLLYCLTLSGTQRPDEYVYLYVASHLLSLFLNMPGGVGDLGLLIRLVDSIVVDNICLVLLLYKGV